jgi:hypothetical protein
MGKRTMINQSLRGKKDLSYSARVMSEQVHESFLRRFSPCEAHALVHHEISIVLCVVLRAIFLALIIGTEAEYCGHPRR